jgi:hypothetical protein
MALREFGLALALVLGFRRTGRKRCEMDDQIAVAVFAFCMAAFWVRTGELGMSITGIVL